MYIHASVCALVKIFACGRIRVHILYTPVANLFIGAMCSCQVAEYVRLGYIYAFCMNGACAQHNGTYECVYCVLVCTVRMFTGACMYDFNTTWQKRGVRPITAHPLPLHPPNPLIHTCICTDASSYRITAPAAKWDAPLSKSRGADPGRRGPSLQDRLPPPSLYRAWSAQCTCVRENDSGDLSTPSSARRLAATMPARAAASPIRTLNCKL